MPENTSNEMVGGTGAATFLQDIAPGERRQLVAATFNFQAQFPRFGWPAVELYCSDAKCTGFRFADPAETSFVQFTGFGRVAYLWCEYNCRNCKSFLKLYGIALTSPKADHQPGSALKVGEYPLFGPHLPPGVVELLGGDSEYFLKGHRSEAQGLGIAAFAYYRRVVENQRTHIFDEIISAAEHVGADSGMIERLKNLRQHWRFQQSVDELKGCLPQIL